MLFGYISKKEYMQKLEEQLSDTRKELIELERKTALDLTRGCLDLVQMDSTYSVDTDKYENKNYLQQAFGLLATPMFKDEIKRIVYENTKYIAEQAPSEQSVMLSRGTINGVSVLLERIENYAQVIEQEKLSADESSV